MKKLKLNQNPDVIAKFKSYPKEIESKLNYLRDLILKVAEENDEITEIEETLKWGEPSYLVKKGSTIRIDWKPKKPNQYAMYFKCTSKLVNTFKEVYEDQFQYETTRAIVFKMDDEVPVKPIKACIEMALRYHYLKELPLLGYQSS